MLTLKRFCQAYLDYHREIDLDRVTHIADDLQKLPYTPAGFATLDRDLLSPEALDHI